MKESVVEILLFYQVDEIRSMQGSILVKPYVDIAVLGRNAHKRLRVVFAVLSEELDQIILGDLRIFCHGFRFFLLSFDYFNSIG